MCVCPHTLSCALSALHREHALALKAAADEWQVRHGVERILTCGFLSGGQPVVDLYELKVLACVCVCVLVTACPKYVGAQGTCVCVCVRWCQPAVDL